MMPSHFLIHIKRKQAEHTTLLSLPAPLNKPQQPQTLPKNYCQPRDDLIFRRRTGTIILTRLFYFTENIAQDCIAEIAWDETLFKAPLLCHNIISIRQYTIFVTTYFTIQDVTP